FTCTNTSDIENIVKPIVDSIKFDKTKATTKTDDNVSLAETTTVLSTTSTNKVKTTVADEKNSESITYAVGKDILPGEYIFNPYSFDTTPYVLVKTTNDDNAKIIGIFSGFDSQIYLTLEYGQYVTILDAKMERVTYETVGKNNGKGCFRVGIDIPAGKYRITADDEDYSSYCISSDSFVKSFSITKGDFISFNDEYDLTLHDGEYLYLDNANLEAMIGN
ncbi:MAG: hypothetical protein K2H01_09910, partial [Ruminococcus sp.]|nr:hypothetical protein [Ruminococcus sp.]